MSKKGTTSTNIKDTNGQETKDQNYITEEKLNSVLDKFLDNVKDLIESKVPMVIKEEKAIETVESSAVTGISDPTIPVEYRQIVDSTLGKEFGIRISYPSKGSGFIFRVVVPREKSNASDFHYEMYKEDIRSKALAGGEGSDAIKLFCERVAKNLNINQIELRNAAR